MTGDADPPPEASRRILFRPNPLYMTLAIAYSGLLTFLLWY
jgi:hypothetical protein